MTQFYINFSRQEHQIDVSYVSFKTWDSQVSAYTPFIIRFCCSQFTSLFFRRKFNLINDWIGRIACNTGRQSLTRHFMFWHAYHKIWGSEDLRHNCQLFQKVRHRNRPKEIKYQRNWFICRKLKCSYIFATWCNEPLIFQTKIIWPNRIHRLKNQRVAKIKGLENHSVYKDSWLLN